MIDFKRNHQDRIIYIGISMFVILLSILCFKRQALTWAENDFTGEFVREAIRFLNGDPLKLTYHPPFYSLALSSLYLVMFKDWIISGWSLSLISSCIGMITSYHFVKLTFGKKEAVGTVLALMFSWVFISFSIQASSDMFFFSLFYCTLFAIAMAEKKQKKYFWVIGGIFAGLTFLTRSNGIPVIFILLFALVSTYKNLSRKKILVFMISGMMLPIILWTLYAEISGSPVYVQSNYKNLVLSYFPEGGDRYSGELTAEARREFSNIWQVLAKDPKHILIRYIKDLLKSIMKLFTVESMIAFPFIVFALPGILLLFFTKLDPFKLILLINLLAMFLFVNLHAWMDRLYLFMIPIMGAGIFTLIDHMYLHFNLKLNTRSLVIIAPILVLIFLTNIKVHYGDLIKSEAIDSLAASKELMSKKNIKEALIFSHDADLSFYTGSKRKRLPNVKTFEELQASIKKNMFHNHGETTAYLFYGFSERMFRPQFSALQNSHFHTSWLKKEDSGNENGGWVLYKILINSL